MTAAIGQHIEANDRHVNDIVDIGINQEFKKSLQNYNQLFEQSPEAGEFKPTHRKISNEIDFDSQLCNRVDMLLNQNVSGKTKNNALKYENSDEK